MGSGLRTTSHLTAEKTHLSQKLLSRSLRNQRHVTLNSRLLRPLKFPHVNYLLVPVCFFIMSISETSYEKSLGLPFRDSKERRQWRGSVLLCGIS